MSIINSCTINVNLGYKFSLMEMVLFSMLMLHLQPAPLVALMAPRAGCEIAIALSAASSGYLYAAIYASASKF